MIYSPDIELVMDNIMGFISASATADHDRTVRVGSAGVMAGSGIGHRHRFYQMRALEASASVGENWWLQQLVSR